MKKADKLGLMEERHLQSMMERYPMLKIVESDFRDAYGIMKYAYERDGKLLIAGNGGSAADSEHMAGELMKKFRLSRTVDAKFADALKRVDERRGSLLAKNLERSLMAIPLVAHEALVTAYINDVDAYGVFAQQLYGYGRKGDVFLAISTSGNSENILNAAIVAKASGIQIIGLTGSAGGKLAGLADVTVKVPESETYKVQELHLPIYHCWCMMLEEAFFGAGKRERE